MKHNLRTVSSNVIYVINHFKVVWSLNDVLLIYRFKYEGGINKIRNGYLGYLEIIFIRTDDLIDNMYNI